MKYFAFAVLVAQAALQMTNAQVIRTSGPILGSCGNALAGPLISSIGGPLFSSIAGPCSCGAPIIAPPCSCGAQIISSPCSAPVIAAPSIVAPVIQNSVASSLADTLSLLTVSSLLAEALPLGPSVVGLPVPSGCGCGCGSGYGGLGCGCGFGGLGYGGYYY